MSSPGYSTKEDVMENLLIVDVLFTSMQVAEIREIVTYGWGNFLGRSEESVPLSGSILFIHSCTTRSISISRSLIIVLCDVTNNVILRT